MLTKNLLSFVFLAMAAFSMISCASTPKYDKISANYLSCDQQNIKPVEITDHGWYQSWYVNCEGKQYFCRYNSSNLNGWNGCRVSAIN